MQFFTFSPETLAILFGDNYSTASKSVTVGDQQIEIVEVKAKSDPSKEGVDFKKMLEDKFNELSSKNEEFVGKVSFEEISAKVEELQKKHDEISLKISELATPVAPSGNTEEPTKNVESEAVAGVVAEVEAAKSLLAEVSKNQEALTKSIVTLASMVSKVTPAVNERSESSKSITSPKEDDLTSYFQKVVRFQS